MLRHGDIWRAIDRLAAENGMTASGLARRAGLDPTTFNRSKRLAPDGKARWPSTESLSKVLDATRVSLTDFVRLYGDGRSQPREQRRIPVIGYAQAGNDGFFDDAGFPSGRGWDELIFPDGLDEQAYALEISGASMEPVYRDGDIIIVSPQAQIRRGDRVVVRTRSGEVMAKQLQRETATRLDLLSLNQDHPNRSLLREEISWIARILWASQ